MKIMIAMAALLGPTVAHAADRVTLTSEVFVEREVRDAQGKPRIELDEPKVVTPGDRLLFVLNYKNVGTAPATSFTVTNPIPTAVLYSAAVGAGEQLSVDGGKNWGALPELTVRNADGTSRAARPADVTHVRWTLEQPIPAGGQGKLSFRGAVK